MKVFMVRINYRWFTHMGKGGSIQTSHTVYGGKLLTLEQAVSIQQLAIMKRKYNVKIIAFNQDDEAKYPF